MVEDALVSDDGSGGTDASTRGPRTAHGAGDARAAILIRIRDAIGAAPEVETPARAYLTSGSRPRDAVLATFLERLEDYGVILHRCSRAELAGEVAAALAARNGGRLVIPEDLDPAWLADADAAWLRDEALPHDTLDRADGVVTTCAVAIAETGTIVLDAGQGQGRRAISLLPDYHLCVVPAELVVETVPEGVARLADAVRAGRPLTMISGPSATSDIELIRVEGVHGPRTLEVVLVEG